MGRFRKICANIYSRLSHSKFIHIVGHFQHFTFTAAALIDPLQSEQVPLLHLQDYLLDLQHYHKIKFSSRSLRVRLDLFFFGASHIYMRIYRVFSRQVIALHLTFCGFHAEFSRGFQFRNCC